MSKLEACQSNRDRMEVGIHGGVRGVVSGDDSITAEPDDKSGGDDGVGCVGQVIYIDHYVFLTRI